MARLLVEPTFLNRFAVYCGAGVYVSNVDHTDTQNPVISVGPLQYAKPATRATAVAALRLVRRAGVPAWVVRHPDFAAVTL